MMTNFYDEDDDYDRPRRRRKKHLFRKILGGALLGAAAYTGLAGLRAHGAAKKWEKENEGKKMGDVEKAAHWATYMRHPLSQKNRESTYKQQLEGAQDAVDWWNKRHNKNKDEGEQTNTSYIAPIGTIITFAIKEKKKNNEDKAKMRKKLLKRIGLGLAGAATLYGGTAAVRAALDVRKQNKSKNEHNKDAKRWANVLGTDPKEFMLKGESYLPRFKHRLLHPLSK